MLNLDSWKEYIKTLNYQPLFVTLSGAHLYGFPSPDSDIDLRGTHQLPLREIVGLSEPQETLEIDEIYQDTEVDLVSHDIGKYFRLLIKNNGYVLEQIFSPLVVFGEEFLKELRPIAQRCITKHHYHHYRGFYASQRKLLDKQQQKTAKAVLYSYRVLLTGAFLLETGDVEANLIHLSRYYRLSFIDELIAQKTAEYISPKDLDWPFHEARLEVLEKQLDQAFADSTLPEGRDSQPLNELLVRLRLESASDS